MKFVQYIFSILVFIVFVSACSNGPQPISYSQDACDFCRMTIVDKQHAAQLVTEKGRNYKYDAIECMVHDLKNWDRPPVDLMLVTDYANPGKLFKAENASFLISKNIPSPMGAFLSAFENTAEVTQTQKKFGGEIYTWAELRGKLND
ncbi:nitrous oxide reductase accessory protein NosL [Fulvivirga lutimaris]|uniref:nitrous oxide reductase accessory protein NosL n=1 Tax=Fulvivirga lutimaris TaxID=1819566 RepID=UPI0012BBCA99|nr:nitrous oxide reductase accessory protein NosL [Fulvivirga lutimaris]MTI40453.1 hypothetical protein [Fulvivirga lutimaris]